MKSEKKYCVKSLRNVSTIFSFSLILFMVACATPTVSSDDSDETDEQPNSVSSVTMATPCKTESEDNCEYGELKDERDGNVYKTVKIGEQVWMAENLNYATEKGSSCYNDKAGNCTKYGRLYKWAAAMDSSTTGCGYGLTCSLTLPVQGVCPTGWHLPSKAEWDALIVAVDGNAVEYSMSGSVAEYRFNVAGKALKSQTGWDDGGNGTDAYGFSALPAGDWISGGKFMRKGESAIFWSSTESASDGEIAWLMGMSYDDDYAYQTDFVKYRGVAVRCVKD
ncbi:fibrobacter succinogenes major paralogous domain-containing protein [uncultured Fibrobacter sp.]|uniref:fibrobacter succinogenes major paralogous domain-containing protein n=1 Tax=uncultured Fibrobacter sp. TaxID=261512 RepID=UPI0025D5BBBA|nr:fibrobacter succinogenes major paralogous domain-containing protein [uncultured Fibrobacter sp.]